MGLFRIMIKKLLLPLITTFLQATILVITHNTLYYLFPIFHESIGFGLTIQYTAILFLTLIFLFNYYLEFFNKNLYTITFILMGIVSIFPIMAIDYRPYRSLLLITLALFGFLSSIIIKRLKKKKD